MCTINRCDIVGQSVETWEQNESPENQPTPHSPEKARERHLSTHCNCQKTNKVVFMATFNKERKLS